MATVRLSGSISVIDGTSFEECSTLDAGEKSERFGLPLLAASQTAEQQAMQLVLEAERSHELQARLKQEQKTARLQRNLLGAVGLALLITTGLGLFALHEYRKSRISKIQAIAKASETLFASGRKLEALVEAI